MVMNGKRRKIIGFGVAAAALVLLFPAWTNAQWAVGHHFIFSGPSPLPDLSYPAVIDSTRLLISLCAVGLLTVAALLVVKN